MALDEVFEFSVRVYIEDTDVGGIVYYGNYLKFMERARTEFLRHYQISQQQLKQQGYLFVVKSAHCDYKASALLDDQLSVSVSIESCSAATVVFNQEVRTDKLLCSGQVVVVCVSAKNMKPVRFPKAIKQLFKPAH